VSPGTASKALNNLPGISQSTRERVLKASEDLDYRPNDLVKSIFTGRSYTVGLLTSDSFGRFSGPIMSGAEDALGKGQLLVIMCDSRGDPLRETEYIDMLIGRRVDGLIVTGRCSNTRPPVASRTPFPVVYAHTPSSRPEDLSIMVDDRGAGCLAARHLIDTGRKRIAHITGPLDFDAVRFRAAGFTETLREHGLQPIAEPLAGYWCEAWGRDAAQRLLSQHPDVDAIYCGSDLLARGVTDALRAAGRNLPDDIALVGTDNWRLIAEATRPALTTVDLNLNAVGRRSAQALVDAIDGHTSTGPEIVPATLVVRASTGVPYEQPGIPKAGHYHESCIHGKSQ